MPVGPDAGGIADAGRLEKEETWVYLVSIAHADLSAPLRLTSNGAQIVSRGDTYYPFRFEADLGSQEADRPTRSRLVVSAVSEDLDAQGVTIQSTVVESFIRAVRGISSAASVTVEIIYVSAPDVVQRKLANVTLRNVSWNLLEITGDLVPPDILSARYGKIFHPGNAPGMFRK